MRTIKDHDLCGAMRELLVQAEERKALENMRKTLERA